jgi:hypothetical protein
MAKTRHSVDIDLTTVPAQRVSHDDTLEVVHDAVADPRAVVAAPSDRRRWLAVLALVGLAGFGVGVPAGILMAPGQTAPPPSPARNDIGGLLLDPLGTRLSQPAAPTDPQDLVIQVVTAGPR